MLKFFSPIGKLLPLSVKGLNFKIKILIFVTERFMKKVTTYLFILKLNKFKVKT
jgi:hypothetical protein